MFKGFLTPQFVYLMFLTRWWRFFSSLSVVTQINIGRELRGNSGVGIYFFICNFDHDGSSSTTNYFLVNLIGGFL